MDTRSSARPRIGAAIGIGAVVTLLAAGVMLGLGDDDPTPSPNPGPGVSMGSCVALYDLENLRDRETAFDGEVAAVEGDVIEFTVHEWFKGGADRTVRLGGAMALGGMTSGGEALSLQPGTRLLVAGDGGFAWGCGFTQPYDAGVADAWRSAIGP